RGRAPRSGESGADRKRRPCRLQARPQPRIRSALRAAAPHRPRPPRSLEGAGRHLPLRSRRQAGRRPLLPPRPHLGTQPGGEAEARGGVAGDGGGGVGEGGQEFTVPLCSSLSTVFWAMVRATWRIDGRWEPLGFGALLRVQGIGSKLASRGLGSDVQLLLRYD